MMQPSDPRWKVARTLTDAEDKTKFLTDKDVVKLVERHVVHFNRTMKPTKVTIGGHSLRGPIQVTGDWDAPKREGYREWTGQFTVRGFPERQSDGFTFRYEVESDVPEWDDIEEGV